MKNWKEVVGSNVAGRIIQTTIIIVASVIATGIGFYYATNTSIANLEQNKVNRIEMKAIVTEETTREVQSLLNDLYHRVDEIDRRSKSNTEAIEITVRMEFNLRNLFKVLSRQGLPIDYIENIK